MKKILLADDSNTVLMLQRLMLKDLGYALVIARNGQEAVEKAIAEQPDLIFMDVVMPVLDGFGAVRRIREQPSLKATPIIMVTTRGEPENVEQGYAAGCNEYITKPFESIELIAKLRAWLGE